VNTILLVSRVKFVINFTKVALAFFTDLIRVAKDNYNNVHHYFRDLTNDLAIILFELIM